MNQNIKRRIPPPRVRGLRVFTTCNAFSLGVAQLTSPVAISQDEDGKDAWYRRIRGKTAAGNANQDG